MKNICNLLLWIFGWKVKGNLPKDTTKCVLITAPHTSKWDFAWGRLGLTALGYKGKFIIKQESFFFPLGSLLRWLGAIPINRANGSFVKVAIQYFKEYNDFVLVIAPEGTKKKTDTWKRGFWLIAKKANVPIVLSSIDYKKKELEIMGEFVPTDTFEDDIREIQKKYLEVTAKYPKDFNLSQMYRK